MRERKPDVITDLWYKSAVIYNCDVRTYLDANGDGAPGRAAPAFCSPEAPEVSHGGVVSPSVECSSAMKCLPGAPAAARPPCAVPVYPIRSGNHESLPDV